ncbi:MAG: hypothetical protein H0X72_00155 [Acidobacteria bacterium]|jgi:hypothetical protein|nr:hypothetical protein [Acidobacteriota bacterium]
MERAKLELAQPEKVFTMYSQPAFANGDEFAESSARQSKSGGQESNLLIQCIPDGIRQKLKSGNNPTNR